MPLAAALPRLAGALDPGNGEARDWLERELEGPAYREHNDPLARALDAIERFVDGLLNADPSAGGALPAGVAGLVTAAVVGLLVFALRYVRRDHRQQGRAPEAVLGLEHLSAAQFRERGARALADGRYADAVLDAMRAIAQGAAERTLLDEVPSLTAHEIGIRLSEPFPALAGELRWAADLFDEVAYGHLEPKRALAERIADLDDRLARTRPAARWPRGRPGDDTAGSSADPSGDSADPSGGSAETSSATTERADVPASWGVPQ